LSAIYIRLKIHFESRFGNDPLSETLPSHLHNVRLGFCTWAVLSGVGVLSSHDNLGRWGFANPVLLHVWWAYVFSEVVEGYGKKYIVTVARVQFVSSN